MEKENDAYQMIFFRVHFLSILYRRRKQKETLLIPLGMETTALSVMEALFTPYSQSTRLVKRFTEETVLIFQAVRSMSSYQE